MVDIPEGLESLLNWDQDKINDWKLLAGDGDKDLTGYNYTGNSVNLRNYDLDPAFYNLKDSLGILQFMIDSYMKVLSTGDEKVFYDSLKQVIKHNGGIGQAGHEFNSCLRKEIYHSWEDALGACRRIYDRSKEIVYPYYCHYNKNHVHVAHPIQKEIIAKANDWVKPKEKSNQLKNKELRKTKELNSENVNDPSNMELHSMLSRFDGFFKKAKAGDSQLFYEFANKILDHPDTTPGQKTNVNNLINSLERKKSNTSQVTGNKITIKPNKEMSTLLCDLEVLEKYSNGPGYWIFNDVANMIIQSDKATEAQALQAIQKLLGVRKKLTNLGGFGHKEQEEDRWQNEGGK